MKGKIEIELKHILPLLAALLFFIMYGVLMVIVAFNQGDYLTGSLLSAATLWWSNVLVTVATKAKQQLSKK